MHTANETYTYVRTYKRTYASSTDKKEEKKHFGCLATFWFGTFTMLMSLDVLFVVKTHEDELYCVIKAYGHLEGGGQLVLIVDK